MKTFIFVSKFHNMKYFFYTIVSALFMMGCSKEESLSPEEQLIKDTQIIEQYLKDNNLTAQKTTSGLQYIITEPGTGDNPTATSSAKLKYKGYFTNKDQFDGTIGNEVIVFDLSKNLIAGFKESVFLLKRGGKGSFLLPSYLGYGNKDYSKIPANSVLIFDIELVDF